MHREHIEGLPPDLAAATADAARQGVAGLMSRHTIHPTTAWLDAGRVSHTAYRAAHRRTTADLLTEIAVVAGLEGPMVCEKEVTVLCVTKRPWELSRVLANFTRQTHLRRRLLLILNADSFDERVVESALVGLPEADFMRVDERRTLGHCLNHGIRRASTRYVAKFDDDDDYGPHYLHDMLLTHSFANAAVVGKHSYAAHISSQDVTVVRAPAREFQYTSHVAGGTIIIDRDRLDGIEFPDLSIGEDGGFLSACERAGRAVCSSDRFNYLQRRHDGNTWVVPDREYLRGALRVGSGARFDHVLV